MNLYEKKYKEALKLAKSYHDDPNCFKHMKGTLEHIFPELGESEDERIRQEMIDFLQETIDNVGESPNIWTMANAKKWLAWLEKQGEQKTAESTDLRTWKYIVDAVLTERNGIGQYIDSPWTEYMAKKLQERFGTIEQKPTDKFDIPDNRIENDISVTSRMEHVSEALKPIAKFILGYSHWNLHKDEWNHPVPEVPLFRVLDALVQEGKPYQGCDSCIEQKPVEDVNDEDYGIDGLYVAMDILNKTLGQVEGYQSDDGILSHKCALTAVKKLYEQKPEWSEEDKTMAFTLMRDIEQASFISKEGKDERIKWLNNLTDRCLPQSKQEWSEEDEQMICSIIFFLAGFMGNDDKIGWLNALKDRVVPQTKQEWTQEDIEMIEWLIRCCEKEHEELCNDRYGHQDIVSDLKRDCRKKWDWLDNLKNRIAPQKQWKPSEEQITALANAKEELGFDYNALQSLCNDLLKLKEL